jgi:EmrB/QacA subfamily drug resistance transporter
MNHARDRAALGVLCSAQLMLIVDVVALNVALPSMQRSLDIPSGQLQFAGVAYTLTFGSLLVVAGRAGDLLGRRRLFRIGLAVFTVASLLNAVAPSGSWLFVGRALQGAGAALVSPTALSMLTSTFAEGERRNRVLGVWAAVGSAGAIVGQVLGGVLTDLFDWRAIFLINIPIGVAAVLFVSRFIPESFGAQARLDLRGAALLTASVETISLALMRVADHGADGWLLLGGAAAGLTAAVLWLAERRHTAPLLKVELLRNRGVRAGNGVLALLAGGTAGALFFATLYLQGSLDYSPSAVGVAFAPVTGIVLCVSPIAGRLAGRFGARNLLVIGAACTGVGLGLLSRMGVDGSYLTDVLPGLAIVALGNGLAYAPTMIVATSGIDDADQGLASGLIGTSQELGTAVGLAAVAPIAAAVTRSSGVVSADAAAIDGYRAGLLVAGGLVALAVVIATRTPRELGRAEPSEPDSPAMTRQVARDPVKRPSPGVARPAPVRDPVPPGRGTARPGAGLPAR